MRPCQPARLPLLLPAVLVVLLAGCGSDSTVAEPSAPGEETSAAPATTAPETTAPTTTPPATSATPEPWRLVGILTGSATGAQASTTGVRLDGPDAVTDFTAQLTRPPLAQEVAETVEATDVPPGSALYAAVVAVGCDVPPGVRVEIGPETVSIYGTKVTTRPVQCLVPVTSVALVVVADR